MKEEAPSAETCHELGCKACPLNAAELTNPKMPPSGAKQPIVYILGEAPGQEEDFQGVQFVGRSGKLLRNELPKKWLPWLRWNNTINCRPTDGDKDRKPVSVEVECCRPRVMSDIEAAQPDAIFGFGDSALEWVTGRTGILQWRGRRLPARIGAHVCWFYPMLHPAFVLRKGNEAFGESDRVDYKELFTWDLERAFADLEREDLPEPVVHSEAVARDAVDWVTGHKEGDVNRVVEFLKLAARGTVLGLDYETTALRPYHGHSAILTAAVSIPSGTLAFPFDHPKAGWAPEDLEAIRSQFEALLLAEAPLKAVHNLAFEMEWTAFFFGRDKLRSSSWGCSQAQAYILDERKGGGRPGCLALDFLCQLHFGLNLKALSNVDTKKLIELPLEQVLPYNGMDAKYHRLLYTKQKALIAQDAGLQAAYDQQVRRIPTVVLTQLKGLPVNQVEAHRYQKQYGGRIIELDDKISDLKVVKAFEAQTGDDNFRFNPQSNPQLQTIFKDMLKRKEGERPRNKYSVDEETLTKVDHPLAKYLLERRRLVKAKSTYIDPLCSDHEDTLIYPDGLLHSSLNTTFTETGRLSSSEPNQQNFPNLKRGVAAGEIRSMIEAPEGYTMVAVDYAQIEARVIAMASLDPVLVKALWEKYDIHMEWAERLAHAVPDRIGGLKNLKDKAVMKRFRSDVKNQWTFPLFYGAMLESSAAYLQVPSRKIAREYEEFWEQFAGVKAWQDDLIKSYKQLGYVETLTKRRRRAPLTVNQIINSPIQGTAADIVLDAMNRLSETEQWTLQPILNIHDDLTFLFPTKRVDEYSEYAIGEMLAVPFDFINVPIGVEAAYGQNWRDLEEFGSFFSNEW